MFVKYLDGGQVTVFRRVTKNDDHPVGNNISSVTHGVNGTTKFGLTSCSGNHATALKSGENYKI